MIQVSAGQSLLDVCLQELGTVEVLFDLAAANGLTITTPLAAGQLLTVPDSLRSRPEVAAYYRQRGQRVNVADQRATAPVVVPPEPAALHDFDTRDFSKQDFY